MSVDSTKMLVHTFVTCRLHNCNSLPYGLPKYLIHSGTPLRPKVAKVEPHTHTKRHAGDFLWSWQAEWLAGACAVHTYVRDRSQKPLIGLKILRQKRHGIVTEHASCFFTLEKFNMADGLLLFMHGNCNIISL